MATGKPGNNRGSTGEASPPVREETGGYAAPEAGMKTWAVIKTPTGYRLAEGTVVEAQHKGETVLRHSDYKLAHGEKVFAASHHWDSIQAVLDRHFGGGK